MFPIKENNEYIQLSAFFICKEIFLGNKQIAEKKVDQEKKIKRMTSYNDNRQKK